MADIVEESFETEVRRKTVRTSYKIEEVSTRHICAYKHTSVWTPTSLDRTPKIHSAISNKKKKITHTQQNDCEIFTWNCIFARE